MNSSAKASNTSSWRSWRAHQRQTFPVCLVDDRKDAELASLASPDPLHPFVAHRPAGSLQTIATFGIDRADWTAALAASVPQGIARIVPIGTALDFDVVWDGRDLLTEMTRLVSLPR
jgi:hypothetical protein